MVEDDLNDLKSQIVLLVAVESRKIFSEEIAKHVADWRERDSKTWRAISDLQSVATRLETMADYSEQRQEKGEIAQHLTDSRITDLRIEWAKEAGRMGAFAGIVSAIIVTVAIQLILPVIGAS